MDATIDKGTALTRLGRIRHWLDRLTPREIDAALGYVDFLEEVGAIDRFHAARWRWKFMACWAERQRRPLRKDRSSLDGSGE